MSYFDDKYKPLETDTDRRNDNLVIYGDRNHHRVNIDIIIEAFADDNTGWYGTGTVYDIYIPEEIDGALFVLTGIEILKQLADTPFVFNKIKYFSSERIFRFISYSDIYLQHIIDAFCHAENAIKRQTRYTQQAEDCRSKLRNLRAGVQSTGSDGCEDHVLQILSPSPLRKEQTKATIKSDETEAAETAEGTSGASDQSDGIHVGQTKRASEPDLEIGLFTKPVKQKRPLCSGKTCPLCARSCNCLRSTGCEGKRGPSADAKISDSTRQQLRGIIRF